MSDEDREAVRRVQAGETEAFEPLVERYRRKTYRLAYGVLRDPEEALDVVQEAFVKAFRALPKFKGDAAFYTWLFRITMNLALDRKRQRATRARVLGGESVTPEEVERTAASADPRPDEEALSVQRRARIARALESLSESHRSIIILSDIEGLSYREIAEVCEIPMGTVMSRLHNARKRLREALGPGFAALLLAAALGFAPPAWAQTLTPTPSPLGPPPGGPVPAPRQAVPRPHQALPGGPLVCVYALVILASNPPVGPPAGGPSWPPQDPRRSLAPPAGRAPGVPRPPPPGVPPPPPGGGGSGVPPPAASEPDDWAERPGAGSGCGRETRLAPWAPRLREVFGYSTFEPMSAFESVMPLGLSQRFALPGGRELEILPLAIRPPMVRLAVKILRGHLAEIATVMDVPPRRPALIGGPPHGGGVLIISIRSRAEP